MTSQTKKVPQAFVRLSESGYLFPCIMQLIYQGHIEPHFDYCSAVRNGLSQQLKSGKIQNYNTALSELSINQAMTLVPNNFMTCLVETTYRLETLYKQLRLT